MPVVAGEGGAEIVGAMARSCTKRQQTQNNRSTMGVQCVQHVVKRNGEKRKRELGIYDLLCAHTPRIMRGRDKNTGAPRVRGSNGRRFCLALPARIPERRATSTGQTLRHEALVNSGPCAGAAARTP